MRLGIEELRVPAVPANARVTLSIGIARYEPGQPVGVALGRAHAALYAAKQSGRNRVEAAQLQPRRPGALSPGPAAAQPR